MRLFLLLLVACSAAPKPLVAEHVVTVEKHVPCATQPPPALPPVPRPTCDAQTCRFTLAAAMQLAENVERLLEWARNTWTLCAPAQPASRPS